MDIEDLYEVLQDVQGKAILPEEAFHFLEDVFDIPEDELMEILDSIWDFTMSIDEAVLIIGEYEE